MPPPFVERRTLRLRGKRGPYRCLQQQMRMAGLDHLDHLDLIASEVLPHLT
jgi:hypothetical protein